MSYSKEFISLLSKEQGVVMRINDDEIGDAVGNIEKDIVFPEFYDEIAHYLGFEIT